MFSYLGCIGFPTCFLEKEIIETPDIIKPSENAIPCKNIKMDYTNDNNDNQNYNSITIRGLKIEINNDFI